ncbi:hypothetical protein FRC06_007413 [Ceratobasidium sp. 370]|nr:hypothetical protein FRC06_007413 [Ceratobasidium sp. 370]
MSDVDLHSDDPTTIPPEILKRLDPEYRDFVLGQPAASRTPLYIIKWSTQLREMVNSSTAGKAKAVPVGAAETVDLGDFSVRIILPDGEPPTEGWPALVYLHGGGWLFGTSQTGESFYTRVCMEARGGNLAAVIAQRATISRPPIRLCAQILLMPLLDLTPTSDPLTWSPSMREYADVVGLYARDLLWSRDLHTPKLSDQILPDASPLLQERAEAFEGMPRAWISVAEMDILRSGGELYARKLKERGVPVELKIYYGELAQVMR